MNININGVNFSGCGNLTIINGCVVSGEGMFGTPQKFDEKKDLRADNVDKITIKSDSADILVTASDTDTVTAHFYGEAITEKKPTLNISKNGQEIVVELTIGGGFMGSTLTLSVNIPKRTFKVLNATGYNGSISIKDGISAKKVKLTTYNGAVECEGSFAEIYASTHNGDAALYIDAKNDVEIDASSHNGNVTVELQNIAASNISTFTKNGAARNRFRITSGGYTAYGRAASHNGNVTVM